VEWATAELLALGSLVVEGTPVRLAGEDTRRGTFSQRHAGLVDYVTGKTWVPITTIPDAKAKFWIYDSLLSEYAALGFEYGYSVANKDAFVGWEGQFGDFMNGAQTIIDQFIVAAEDKWDQTSGLVLLLPHGYEGQGPEHSSARIERFLTMCAEDNVQVVNATTAAQFFHLLRRQMHREVRKPLVVFTPKSYLRRPESRSPVSELTHGSFQEVLDDPGVTDRMAVQRLVFCSGKVAFDALARRDKLAAPVAVIRIEQLFPFPREQLLATLERYPNAKDLVWLQEEPENMGPWQFMFHRSHPVREAGYSLRVVARVESGSPATGSAKIHEQEQQELLDSTFEGW
jgi:2-oxoglutarate dehydrogenase E1 component